MSNEAESKKLIAASYVASAQRIASALAGQLPIRNTREPGSPPVGRDEIIGLCGQRGRHAYFRIPFGALQSCLRRIFNAAALPGRPGYLAEQVMDEIAAACTALRQQTLFDSGTGCVNDTLPSMVPLLPPEEIWYQGRELPLDVWRLISFEFDLVSSAVSSQVSVEDFAFSAVNPNALAFRFLLNQLGSRQTQFQIQTNNIPVGWLAASGTSMTKQVSLARLFFEAGSLLTPFADQDFIKGFAAIRYVHWIDEAASELRVQDKFNNDSVDARYRGLFAEETAIGMMVVVLSDFFGAAPITNTVEALQARAPGSIQPNRPIADFVAQATHPGTGTATTIIAESKGSLGNKVSKARLDRAKVQVAASNVIFAGFGQTLPITFASKILFSKQKGNSQCLVNDPPMDKHSDFLEINGFDAWRMAYAKTLKFVGLETAAKQVFRGTPAESIRPMDFDRDREKQRSDRDFQRVRRAGVARERYGMELLLDVGKYALSIDHQVASILREGINKETERKIAEILNYRRKRSVERSPSASFETSLGFGCISYAELDHNAEKP